ncbi:MAG: hypothetical protein WA988_14890 [Candidatus Nanopelagicales bacterium]
MPVGHPARPLGDDAVPDQVDASRAGAVTSAADFDVESLPLEKLRKVRQLLTERENQVSYWRRIIQARLDLLRDGAVKRGVTVEGLHRILSQQMGANSRKGILSVQPQGDQPLAGLDHLWNRGINGADDDQLELELVAAERELSEERTRLFGLIDAATQELVRRYREDPSLVLSALPRRSQRPAPLGNGSSTAGRFHAAIDTITFFVK